MRNVSRAVIGLFATMAVAGFAGVASAQALNINALAAGVAIPFVTSVATPTSALATTAVITNGSAASRTLHFDLINGDPNEFWEIQSWICTLTARETMEIVFTNDSSGGSNVRFECDDVEGQSGPPFAGNDGNVASEAERGVLWVTVENALGQTVGENILFADFTILDVVAGDAASAEAAGFQGGPVNNGDKKYDFNAVEYSRFPAALATNFQAPATWDGRLLLFTLDGIPGLPPAVRARLLWYNDDEDFEDDAIDFKCMAFLRYSDIAPGLGALTTAGHMSIIPVTEPLSAIKRPLLCYNIQEAPLGGSTLRSCAQSTAAFIRPLPEPSLDTQL